MSSNGELGRTKGRAKSAVVRTGRGTRRDDSERGGGTNMVHGHENNKTKKTGSKSAENPDTRKLSATSKTPSDQRGNRVNNVSASKSKTTNVKARHSEVRIQAPVRNKEEQEENGKPAEKLEERVEIFNSEATEDSDTKLTEYAFKDAANSYDESHVGPPFVPTRKVSAILAGAEMDPFKFQGSTVLDCINSLSVTLESERFRNAEMDISGIELHELVTSLDQTVDYFKSYTQYTQRQLEILREKIRVIKEAVFKKMNQKPYDPKSASFKVSLEERELEAKVQQLNRELAAVHQELVKASEVSIEADLAAVKASLAAEKAADEARSAQAEYEARRLAEQESKIAEEERKIAERLRAKEEAEKAEMERRREEERKATLRGKETKEDEEEQEDAQTPEWSSWHCHICGVSPGEFDQGVGCAVRYNPEEVKSTFFACSVVDPLQSSFSTNDSEELISHIIRLSATKDEHVNLQAPIYVALPHSLNRTGTATREPVMTVEDEETHHWTALESVEVTLEEYKDIKFVQARVHLNSTIAVISRYKRDFLQLPKRGGVVASSVDRRLTFAAEKGTFNNREFFVVQVQPVDPNIVSNLRASSTECRGLLASSSIINSEWSSKSFNLPLTVNMVVYSPPSTSPAKKAAAIAAARDARITAAQQNNIIGNSTGLAQQIQPADGEEEKRSKKAPPVKLTLMEVVAKQQANDKAQVEKPKPPKWYMGEYGENDDSGNDRLHCVRKLPNGRWTAVEGLEISQIKQEIVRINLVEPMGRFAILRTNKETDEKNVALMIETLEKKLLHKSVVSILRQRPDEPTDCILELVPQTKLEKTLKSLEDLGYSYGPPPSALFSIKDGDRIQISLRGNIKFFDQNEARDDDDNEVSANDETLELSCNNCNKKDNLMKMFFSQRPNTIKFLVMEKDRFLQRDFEAYRGLVQISRMVKVKPQKRLGQQNRKTENATMNQTSDQIKYTAEFLCEQLINLPKFESDEYSTLHATSYRSISAPSHLTRDKYLSEETLRDLAAGMGEEWETVAYYLNVKKPRIQAIVRNNTGWGGGEGEREACGDVVKYDMLVAWLKRTPRNFNKVEMLKNALSRSGRHDLAVRLYTPNRAYSEIALDDQ